MDKKQIIAVLHSKKSIKIYEFIKKKNRSTFVEQALEYYFDILTKNEMAFKAIFGSDSASILKEYNSFMDSKDQDITLEENEGINTKEIVEEYVQVEEVEPMVKELKRESFMKM